MDETPAVNLYWNLKHYIILFDKLILLIFLIKCFNSYILPQINRTNLAAQTKQISNVNRGECLSVKHRILFDQKSLNLQ